MIQGEEKTIQIELTDENDNPISLSNLNKILFDFRDGNTTLTKTYTVEGTEVSIDETGKIFTVRLTQQETLDFNGPSEYQVCILYTNGILVKTQIQEIFFDDAIVREVRQ